MSTKPKRIENIKRISAIKTFQNNQFAKSKSCRKLSLKNLYIK